MSTIIGIDPGANTGIAVAQNGQLYSLRTIEPQDLQALLREYSEWSELSVVFEDSRKQSHVWMTNANRVVALKMARDLGQVDAWCSLIESACAQHAIPCTGVSPKAKGAKVTTATLKRLTGWEGRSNQHERDAAMLVIGGKS